MQGMQRQAGFSFSVNVPHRPLEFIIDLVSCNTLEHVRNRSWLYRITPKKIQHTVSKNIHRTFHLQESLSIRDVLAAVRMRVRGCPDRRSRPGVLQRLYNLKICISRKVRLRGRVTASDSTFVTVIPYSRSLLLVFSANILPDTDRFKFAASSSSNSE